MDDLTTAPGIVAIAAGVLALLALAVCLLLALRIRELRQAQQTVLGEGGARDVVAHARDLEQSLDGLERHLDEIVARLEGTEAELTTRLDGAVTHCAVVRYDAMGEMTGRQSSSVALLDSHRSGVVLSSILHREQARLYAKQIIEGESEFELSPEEKEALQTALESPARR